MEETKETSKLTYEQLEEYAARLQKAFMEAETKLRSIDFASMRLTWLFRVLEHRESFNFSFTEKCAQEIENILTIETVTDEQVD